MEKQKKMQELESLLCSGKIITKEEKEQQEKECKSAENNKRILNNIKIVSAFKKYLNNKPNSLEIKLIKEYLYINNLDKLYNLFNNHSEQIDDIINAIYSEYNNENKTKITNLFNAITYKRVSGWV